jgi:hypothetical protein
MWSWRTDWPGEKMCAQAHVQILAHEWESPVPAGGTTGRRHRPHVTPRHGHHLQLHFPLHAAH